LPLVSFNALRVLTDVTAVVVPALSREPPRERLRSSRYHRRF
jgi:hypothetical protein